MKIILAVNNLGYIGLNGKLPWESPEDLSHFKKLTLGKTLIVGRSTFEKMPKLKGRSVVVVGKGYNTLEEALSKNPDWCIGGSGLVQSVCHLCSELHLSFINDDTIGDTGAPDFENFKGHVFRYKFNAV